ncbi:MAG: GNAT family N-acetyltransferase [Candidatus Magasanikbacteria bacterium]|nr:GNAT family N-acetyltransferase [Candidatus Magasanikbacteria bacterium]
MTQLDTSFCLLDVNSDLTAIEDIQRQAWRLDDLIIVPTHLFQAVCKYDAGLVVGALAEGKLVGFILALETRDKQTQHIHMIGVHPDWQGMGQNTHVGFGLLRCYREAVLPRGVKEARWTFDPLLGQNANLYFRKIGVRAVLYEPDAYGQSSETGIYQGLPTDRLLVAWRLEKERDRFKLSPEDLHSIPAVISVGELKGNFFVMEIPLDMQELKRRNPQEALEIRLRTREIFLSAIMRGYQVIDFVHDREEGRNFYLFCHFV